MKFVPEIGTHVSYFNEPRKAVEVYRSFPSETHLCVSPTGITEIIPWQAILDLDGNLIICDFWKEFRNFFLKGMHFSPFQNSGAKFQI